MPFHTCPKQTNKKEEEMKRKKSKEEQVTNPPHITVTVCALWSFCLISWSIFGSIKKSPLLAVQSVRQISMVNLEKLLVAASGRLATTEENVQWSPPRQSRRKVSFADDEKANDHTESSRKLSISQLPPKKDLAILDNGDDCRSREGGIEDCNDEISELEMLPEARATGELTRISEKY